MSVVLLTQELCQCSAISILTPFFDYPRSVILSVVAKVFQANQYHVHRPLMGIPRTDKDRTLGRRACSGQGHNLTARYNTCWGHGMETLSILLLLALCVGNLPVTGPWFNIKMPSYQYRKPNCGDKTVVRSSYLHNGISYTGKMASFNWISPLVVSRDPGSVMGRLMFSLLLAWGASWIASRTLGQLYDNR